MSETRFKLLRKSDRVASVPDRWERQYTPFSQWDERKFQIHVALQALKGTKFSASQVDEIIGNTSWTYHGCDCCHRDADELVRMGDEPDYESRWVDVCRECLKSALDLTSW